MGGLKVSKQELHFLSDVPALLVVACVRVCAHVRVHVCARACARVCLCVGVRGRGRYKTGGPGRKKLGKKELGVISIWEKNRIQKGRALSGTVEKALG